MYRSRTFVKQTLRLYYNPEITLHFYFDTMLIKIQMEQKETIWKLVFINSFYEEWAGRKSSCILLQLDF